MNFALQSSNYASSNWAKIGVAVTGQVVDVTSAGHCVYQAFTVVPGQSYTFAFSAKRGTKPNVSYAVYDETHTAYITPITSYLSSINPETPTLLAYNFVVPAGCTVARVYITGSDGSTGTVTVTEAALFKGTYTAAQIQALGGIPLTTTAPASTALGPQYWEFDGSNDSLQLSAVPFQMNDDHCVVLAHNPQRYQATSFGISGGSGSRFASISTASPANADYIEWYDGTNYVPLQTATTLGDTRVISARRVGSVLSGRKNGVQFQQAVAFDTAVQATNSTVGTGALGPVPGAIYPIIAIKGTVSDSQLLTLEKWVAGLSGVTLS